MTSERQLLANRRNARASTGPKTAAGKATAARNALRHGLAVAIPTDPALPAAVEGLAKRIAGDMDRPDVLDCARRVAEAEIDLRRVRDIRARRLERIHEQGAEGAPPPTFPSETDLSLAAGQLREGASTSEGEDAIAASLLATPAALLDLAALDRYERRALSRRRFAIRDFDAARIAAARERAKDGDRRGEIP